MNSIPRITLYLIIALGVSGCSSLNTKQISELRHSVEEQLVLNDTTKTSFCVIQPQVFMEPIPTYAASALFATKLYFLLDKSVFSARSESDAEEIYQDILSRDPSEINVSGHTDTTGSNEHNDALSGRRSERVKQDLINAGLAADIILLSSEGESRLLVATPNGTLEPLNRRVEINLR